MLGSTYIWSIGTLFIMLIPFGVYAVEMYFAVSLPSSQLIFACVVASAPRHNYFLFAGACIIFVAALALFVAAAITEPGILPRGDVSKPAQILSQSGDPLTRATPISAASQKDILTGDGGPGGRYCETCHLFRAPRSKHCKFCNNWCAARVLPASCLTCA
jgi:hypothetical protein